MVGPGRGHALDRRERRRRVGSIGRSRPHVRPRKDIMNRVWVLVNGGRLPRGQLVRDRRGRIRRRPAVEPVEHGIGDDDDGVDGEEKKVGLVHGGIPRSQRSAGFSSRRGRTAGRGQRPSKLVIRTRDHCLTKPRRESSRDLAKETTDWKQRPGREGSIEKKPGCD